MAVLRSVNNFLGLYQATFRRFFIWRVWSALTLYAIASTGVLVALLYYLNPYVYSVLQPYLQNIGALVAGLGIADSSISAFSHYPERFLLMPVQFEWAKLPVAILIEGVAIALAARAFAEKYTSAERNRTFSVSLGSLWWQSIVIWLLMYLILSALSYGLPGLFTDWLGGSPRRMQLFEFLLFSGSLLVISPLIYVIPALATASDESQGASLLGALALSVRLFVRHPLSTFLLIYLPGLILSYPLIWAVSPSSGFMMKLKPEMTFIALLMMIFGNLLWNLIYVGTATRLVMNTRR